MSTIILLFFISEALEPFKWSTPIANHAIAESAYVKKIVAVDSQSECENLCENQTSFPCMSVDVKLGGAGMSCRMSDVTRDIGGQEYGEAPSITHLDRVCPF